MGRFLILSQGGDGVGLALRLKLEGHEAKLWIRDPYSENHGKGLVDFAEEYRMGQTVIADCTGLGVLMDKFRDDGVPIFGGSSFADKLETDRQFSEDLMKRAGIEVPQSVRVKSWGDAKKQIEKLAEEGDGGKVVLKPEGSLSGNLPSYVASDTGDALAVLEHWKKSCAGEIELTIQQFIEGQDVSTEGWFNGEDWIPGMFNHTLEKKHVMNGDVGPSGGCSGNIVWRCGEKDPIVKETLLKLTEALRERRYVGCIDINCVVNEEGIYGLEFTPRFGYDSFPTTLCVLCGFDVGAFLSECASGGVPNERLEDGFACGVRLSIPPWPNEKHEAEVGIAVRGMEEEDRRWFYPYHVMMEGEELVSSGGVGILGVMNGKGEVVGEGFARAYELVSRLKIPDVQFRTDLRHSFRDCFLDLQALLSGEEREGWIGVDFDGTLAERVSSVKKLGDPVPKMVSRVKRWISEGKEVRILTARNEPEMMPPIYDWCREHLGQAIEVVAKKDMYMMRLYDDRAVQVEKDTGVLVA